MHGEKEMPAKFHSAM